MIMFYVLRQKAELLEKCMYLQMTTHNFCSLFHDKDIAVLIITALILVLVDYGMGAQHLVMVARVQAYSHSKS